MLDRGSGAFQEISRGIAVYRNVANPLEYGLYMILEAISIVYDYPQIAGIIISWLLELFTVFYKSSELTLSPWATRQEEVDLE